MKPVDYFDRNNLPAAHLVTLKKQSVNLVYLTDDFVLRVVRPEIAEYIDHEHEAKLGLKAFDLGIKTAKPVAWDKTYSIWERLPGQPLQNPGTCSLELWDELFGTLELLQQTPLEPLEEPIKAWTGATSLIGKTQNAAKWSKAERAQLYTLLSESQLVQTPCYIHGDAYADNIMVDDESFVGIIDWGNSGWGSLEAECASLDTPALDLALKRWHDRLDKQLLWKMRLNLSLEVASYGRIPISAVRAVLGQLTSSR